MDDSVKVIDLSSDGEDEKTAEKNCIVHPSRLSNEQSSYTTLKQEEEASAEEAVYPIFKHRGKLADGRKRRLRAGTSSVPMGALPLASRPKVNVTERNDGTKATEQHTVSKCEKANKGTAQQLRTTDGQLWVDKYAPVVESQLAVHKKKVAEVRSWLQESVHQGQGASRVLLLTGPAGAGKTAVVQLLARELNFEICEWTAPVPTLWQEHIHQGSAGIPYVSKLSEFQEFLDASARFPALALGPARMEADEEQSRGTYRTSSQVEHQIAGTFGGYEEKRLAAQSPSLETETASRYKQRIQPQQQSATCHASKLIVIEDLPFAGDSEHRKRLIEALHSLVASARYPTIVILTDLTNQNERGDHRQDRIAEIQKVLEEAGAFKIAFNPVAPSNMKKVLSRIAEAEGCKVPPDVMSALAESSSGDIRHAISRLQFHCLGKHLQPSGKSTWDPGGQGKVKRAAFKKRKKKGAQALETPDDQNSAGFEAKVGKKVNNLYSDASRDDILTLFHALGKILYNKRKTDAAFDGSVEPLELLEPLRRQPPDMEEAEAILAHAHTDTGTLSAFLHENVLDFIAEDGIEAVAQMEAYLSDADCLQGTRRGFRSGGSGADSSAAADHVEPDPGRIAAAAAGSVLARGFLFANSHPAPRRFHAFRSPSLWQMERARRLKLLEMTPIACLERGFSVNSGVMAYSLVATELEPFRKRLASLGCTSLMTPRSLSTPKSRRLILNSQSLTDHTDSDVQAFLDSDSEKPLQRFSNGVTFQDNLDFDYSQGGIGGDMEEEIEDW